MAVALRTPGLKASERLVFVYLCDRANGEMVCWPRISVIAGELELSRRSVQGAIGVLAKRGLIQVDQRAMQSSVYRVGPMNIAHQPSKTPAHPPPTLPLFSEQKEGGAQNLPGVQNLHGAHILPIGAQKLPTGGAKNDTKGAQNLRIESSIESSIESLNESPIPRAHTRARKVARVEPEGFAEWYAAYPRKDAGRKATLMAWNRAIASGASPTDLIEGVRRYRFSHDPGMRPMPTTWLNQGRWDTRYDTPEVQSTPKPLNPANLTGAEAFAYKVSLEEAQKNSARPLTSLEKLAYG